MSQVELSIVIPVYYSKDIIKATVTEIEDSIKEWCSSYEFVLVNDGSTDGSAETIREMAQNSNNIKAINLAKNFGQHNAQIAGLNFANGVLIVIMDDDGQHDPVYLKQMYDGIKDGAEVMYVNYDTKIDPLYKNMGSRLNDYMAGKLLNKPDELYLSTYKMFTKQVKDQIIKYSGPYPYIDGLILTSTQHIHSIPAKHRDSNKPATTYSLKKLVSLWLNMFTNFSIKPLRAIFACGLFCGLLAIVGIIAIIVLKITTPEYAPAGWTTNFILIVLFGTIQFISLGLIGEYVGRILLLLNNQPQYIVKDFTGNNN